MCSPTTNWETPFRQQWEIIKNALSPVLFNIFLENDARNPSQPPHLRLGRLLCSLLYVGLGLLPPCQEWLDTS